MSEEQAKYEAEGRALVAESKGRYADIPMVQDSLGMRLMPSNFGELVSFSQMMAKSGAMVRAVFRDNPGACLGVTMKAVRWGLDPWDVANKSYFVNDQMCFEGQLIHTIVLVSGLLTDDDLDFTFEGDGDQKRVRAVGTIKKNNKTREYVSPPIKDIEPKRSPLWKTDPEQQLVYYGVAKWTRRWLPTVLMGVAWTEEVPGDLAKDITPKPTSEQNAARLADKLAAANETSNLDVEHVARESAAVAGEPEKQPDPPAPDYEAHLAAFGTALATYDDADDLNEFVTSFGRRVGEEWWSTAPDDVRTRATELFRARWNDLTTTNDDGDDGQDGEGGAADPDDDSPTTSDLLMQLETQCAALATIEEIDALREAIDDWYSSGDEDRRKLATKIMNDRRAAITAAKVAAAEPAREAKIESAKRDAKSKLRAEIDPDLLSDARAATKKGSKRFKLWTGKLTVVQFDSLAPMMKELEKAAKDADAL